MKTGSMNTIMVLTASLEWNSVLGSTWRHWFSKQISWQIEGSSVGFKGCLSYGESAQLWTTCKSSNGVEIWVYLMKKLRQIYGCNTYMESDANMGGMNFLATQAYYQDLELSSCMLDEQKKQLAAFKQVQLCFIDSGLMQWRAADVHVNWNQA